MQTWWSENYLFLNNNNNNTIKPQLCPMRKVEAFRHAISSLNFVSNRVCKKLSWEGVITLKKFQFELMSCKSVQNLQRFSQLRDFDCLTINESYLHINQVVLAEKMPVFFFAMASIKSFQAQQCSYKYTHLVSWEKSIAMFHFPYSIWSLWIHLRILWFSGFSAHAPSWPKGEKAEGGMHSPLIFKHEYGS